MKKITLAFSLLAILFTSVIFLQSQAASVVPLDEFEPLEANRYDDSKNLVVHKN